MRKTISNCLRGSVPNKESTLRYKILLYFNQQSICYGVALTMIMKTTTQHTHARTYPLPNTLQKKNYNRVSS